MAAYSLNFEKKLSYTKLQPQLVEVLEVSVLAVFCPLPNGMAKARYMLRNAHTIFVFPVQDLAAKPTLAEAKISRG